MSVIQIEGIEKLQHGVSTLRGLMNAGPLKDWMEESVEPWLALRASARFAAEGDTASGKWAQLSEATMRFRRHGGFSPSHPINVRTGQLRRYVVNTSTIRAEPGGASIIKPALGGAGLLEKKFTTAQQGNARTPARPVMGLDATDVIRLTSNLAGWFEEGFRLAAG